MNHPPAVEPFRLRRVPMLAAALCFAAGDLCARHWHGPMLLATAIVSLFALALFSLYRAPRVAIVPALAFWISLGCWCAQIQPPVDTQQALAHYADGLSRTVRGRVVHIRTIASQPEVTETPQGSEDARPGTLADDKPGLSVDLDLQAIEEVTPDASTMQPVKGGIRITLFGEAIPLRCGDVLEVPLRLRTPEVYHDPGAWSYRDQLLSEGIGLLGTQRAERIHLIRHANSNVHCRFMAAQGWASQRLQTYIASSANMHLPRFLRLRGDDAALLNSMLFGERSELNRSLRDGLERTGTFHLFVVSGLHVALFAGILLWLLRRIRVPEGFAIAITLSAATCFAMLAGFGLPLRRALLMTSVYLVARWLGREISALNALGIAALTVLVVDPRSLFEASFQMTFLVILAIAGIGQPLIERTIRPWASALRHLSVVRVDAAIHPRLAQFRVRLRMACHLCEVLLHPRLQPLPVWCLRALSELLQLFVIGIATEACMVLPMALYFHRAALLALPINIVLVPFITALLGLALTTFCASLLSPWLALVPSALTVLFLHALRFFVDHAQHLTLADLRVPAPPAGVIVAVCLALALACWALRQKNRLWLIAGVTATVFIPLAVLWPEPPLLHPNTFEVTAIDVGQGDSLLVVSPDGHTMLVDAGGPVGRATSDVIARWDIGEEVVAPYLWSRRIRRLDVVVLTHAHSDHMGGMPAILRDFHPRELWLGVQPGKAPGMQRLLDEARTLHVTIRWFRAGEALSWGGLHTDVLAPEAAYQNAGTPVNNDSLVLRLAYGNASALLEGDAEAPSEAAMLVNHRIAPSTLLKIGHHGSKTSTTPEFLAAVHPEDAVISVGAHNTFGHPRMEILQRLEASHIRTFRTDRQGAETFLLTSDGAITEEPASHP